jgi:hypothetical protein
MFKDTKIIETAPSKKRLSALSWDLSGKKLVTGASDGTIKVWNE